MRPSTPFLPWAPRRPSPLLLNVFRWCVERFYEFDDDGGWIGTLERENVCDLLDEIADAVGLAEYDGDLPWNGGW